VLFGRVAVTDPRGRSIRVTDFMQSAKPFDSVANPATGETPGERTSPPLVKHAGYRPGRGPKPK
jgi:hypothetical protein